MPPRRRPKPALVDSDSLSEEVEDVSEDFVRPKRPKTHPRDQLDWIEKYAPKTSAEVCVNTRKVKELKDVMSEMVAEGLQCRFLVVTGPSGCGKSTLVKCLGNELIASKKHGADGVSGLQDMQFQHSDHIVEYFDTQLDNVAHQAQFSEFLDGCRYRTGASLAFIVVEELPNVFHSETLVQFRRSIRDWIYSTGNLPPLVLCLTEVEMESDNGQKNFYNIENSLTAETLLGRDLLYHASAAGLLKRVKFLPIAKTFMKKAVSKIIKSEKIQFPPSLEAQISAQLFETGDIRALIAKLQFLYQYGDHNMDVSMSRETLISLFHAVGKVVHSSGKFADMDDDTSDYHSVKAVLDSYSNLPLLNLALLENYHILNGLEYEIAVAADLVDSLSISDTLASVEEAYEFGIRAVRHNLRSVPEAHGHTQPMKFPRHFKMLKAANKVRKEVDSYGRYLGHMQVSFANVNLLDGYLVPAIYNSFRYKLKNGSKPYAYNRIGGKFQEIFADGEVTVMENENEREFGVKDQFLADIDAQMALEITSEQEEDLSEEIANTSTDEDFNDSLDVNLMMMTQKQHDDEASDEFSDDPQLDLLVSQGRL